MISVSEDRDDDRGRGVLTDADRRFLRNPDTYTQEAAYNRREKIRERVWNALLDGWVLLEETTPNQRRDLLSGWARFAEEPPAWELEDRRRRQQRGDTAAAPEKVLEEMRGARGLVGWLSFLYAAMEESDSYHFQALLRGAISRAEEARGRRLVEFEFDVETAPNRSLEDKLLRFQSGEPLGAEELRELWAEGEIDEEDVAAYLGGPEE